MLINSKERNYLNRVAGILLSLFVFMSMMPFAVITANAETEYKGVQPEPPDGYVYDIYAGESGGSVIVVGYVGSDTQTILPTQVKYNGVTYNAWNSSTNTTGNGFFSIGEGLFSGNEKIEKVAVPQGYEAISSSAFKGCTNLTEVAISDTVGFLGNDIFDGDPNLKTYYYSGDELINYAGGEDSAVQMLINSGFAQDANGNPIGGVTVYTKAGSPVEKAVEEINKKADTQEEKITVVNVTDPYKENTVKPETTTTTPSNITTTTPSNTTTTTPSKTTTTTPSNTTATTSTTNVKKTTSKDNNSNAYDKGTPKTVVEKAIVSSNNDNDPKGTSFFLIQARSTKVGKNYVTLQWTKTKGAKKYIVYGNMCNKGKKKYKYVKLATLSGTSKKFKKIKKAKVKKGTYYKFKVVALDKNDKVIATSKTVHVATKGSKVGNDKSVTLKIKKSGKWKAVKKATIKKNKKLKLQVKEIPAKKTLKVQRHRKVSYESSNPKIASVNAKGVIKGKKKGSCYIYAYAQNGVFKKIKVTVK